MHATTRGRAACTCIGLARGRLELQVGLYGGVTPHLVSRDPSRVLQFGFNFLAAHFFRYVRHAQPENANRERLIAIPLVYSHFNLVGLVNVEVERLIGELASFDALLRLIFARRRPRSEGFGEVFAIDSNIGARAAAIA